MTPSPWQHDAGLRRVVGALVSAGGAARLVGGCVRDWRLGRPVGDLDIATTLQPDATIEALKRAEIRPVPTGLKHGTVTAVAEGRGYEVTSLRRDVVTDGRHAIVDFTEDWTEDASRRDFTVNALYADLDGTVHDPLGQGLADLERQELRFVGDPARRIREDYLRILRFYRFAAQLGFHQTGEGRAASRKLASGMARLSVERVWQEMSRLLAGPHRFPILQRMAEDGVLEALLPGAAIPDWLERLTAGDAIPALTALLSGEGKARSLARRWKLSNDEADRLEAALGPFPTDALDNPVALRRLAWEAGVEAANDRLRLAAARLGCSPDAGLRVLADWTPPAFPLSGNHALAIGLKPGPEMGRCLKTVETWWADRDFQPDEAACLDELRRVAGLS